MSFIPNASANRKIFKRNLVQSANDVNRNWLMSEFAILLSMRLQNIERHYRRSKIISHEIPLYFSVLCNSSRSCRLAQNLDRVIASRFRPRIGYYNSRLTLRIDRRKNADANLIVTRNNASRIAIIYVAIIRAQNSYYACPVPLHAIYKLRKRS